MSGNPLEALQKRIVRKASSILKMRWGRNIPSSSDSAKHDTSNYCCYSKPEDTTTIKREQNEELARTLVLNDSIKPLYQSILTSVRLLDFQQHKNNVTNISFISPYYLFLRKALPSCTQLCTHPCLYVFFLLEKEDHPSSSSFLVHFFSPIHLQLIFPSRYILPHHHYHLTIT